MGADAQVDVVAINWHDRSLLLGECKWGVQPVDRGVIRELVEKTPKVLSARGPSSVASDQAWRVQHIFFARAGFTEAARTEAESLSVLLVDLPTLDADLRSALG